MAVHRRSMVRSAAGPRAARALRRRRTSDRAPRPGPRVTGRGAELPRPKPWAVRAVDRQAYQGWQRLLGAAPENLDRAWVALTSDPRHVDQRQHPLKGQLGIVKIGGATLEQWQY